MYIQIQYFRIKNQIAKVEETLEIIGYNSLLKTKQNIFILCLETDDHF